MGSVGCVRQVWDELAFRVHWVCAEEFGAPRGRSLVSQAHLGALHGGALVGFACLWAVCWLAGGADLHQAGPRNALRLSGATSKGSRSKRENAPGGGAEGRKVGAVFPVPGRARSSRGLGTSEEKKELWCDAKYHLLSREVQLQGTRKKHERISGFLFVSVGAKNFLSLSSYQKLLMLCLWCGKPKAVIWAMLLTGFYKCTQKH